MKSLRILYVIDSLGTGGAERDLAEALPRCASAHIEPIVVALRRRQEGVQEEILRQGFDVRFLDDAGMFTRVLALRRIIRFGRPDLIHTVLFHSDIAGRLAAIGTGVKLLSSLVNTDYEEVRSSGPSMAHRLWLARALDGWTARHLTTHLHANSNAVKAAAIRDLRVPAEKITVIEGGRDPGRLGRPGVQRRDQARERLGFEPEHEILLNVGRQDHQKGQRYLLEAVERLIPTRPHLVLLIAGRPGDASPELALLCGRPGIRERVHLLGHRDDVPEILAAADLFVFPSLYEGLPGAVMEAMALGLPVVASDIDPVREVVEEGRNALLVEPQSPVDLAAAIERLLEDRQTALAFGQRGREIFEERFTLESCTSRRLALYRKLLCLP